MLTCVTVIGLGATGPLARAFVSHGHQTTIWNRSPARAEGLAARGATVAPTVLDVITASPIAVLCVLDYEGGERDPRDGAPTPWQGRALVHLTNGTPEQSRRTARWAADYRADYLDGASWRCRR